MPEMGVSSVYRPAAACKQCGRKTCLFITHGKAGAPVPCCAACYEGFTRHKQTNDGTLRFTIDVHRHQAPDYWNATIFDHHDHGSQMPYAEVDGGDLAEVLRQATHYVLVAS